MRMEHLVKPIEQQTDDELLERLRGIRHNREVVRPAAARIVEKAEKKTNAKRTSKIADLLAGMSEEEKATFLKELESGS